MIDVREFRLLGRSDLDHVRSKLERGLATWAARWFQGNEAPALAELDVSCDALQAETRWRILPTSAGAVYVTLQSKTASKLLGHWLVGEGELQSVRAGTDDDWGADFVAGLLEDLMAVTAAAPIQPSWKPSDGADGELPAAYRARTSGALFALVRFGVEQSWFALSPEYVKHLLKDAPKSLPKAPGNRTPAGDAIVSVPMRLRVGAWMEDSLTIDALHGLAVGDVLVLGRKVDEPWPVIAPNGAAIAQCYLGHQGAQQVIKLANAPKEPNRHVK
ncbi:MAG: hypothetical protein JWR16_1201 [Nevskia sp.]|nr:hypothetical protein [Nevskia sp.]